MHLPVFLLLLGATAISCTTPTTTEKIPVTLRTSNHQSCRYWCIYEEPYCCDDGSLTPPPDHLPHAHLECPEAEDQICKSTGIFLNNTYPIMVLAKAHPKRQVLCASDGYCQEDERCCPSPCVKRHICMTGIKREAMKGVLPELVEEEEVYVYEE